MKAIKNVLVTGANGQLGNEFKIIGGQFPAYRFFFAGKEDLAIEDEQNVANFFAANDIDCCINCAAYTAVDKAEAEQEQALAINATAVGNLAAVCKKTNALFIHFSTDYVFNGKASLPYKETDATDPVNFYGHTKLRGEEAAMQQNEHSIVIRTSWVYSRFGKNFVKTMLRLMNEKESIGVVADQYGCPTYAADLAGAVMHIISHGKFTPGIYHYCNEGVISWHEFASAIQSISRSSCRVNAINTAAYPTPAARPHYSALDTSKIKQSFAVQVKPWKQSLQQCITLLQSAE
ncbi:MAG: dTDP-4-dehydrorhamnose reductase [Chitinophagaceae bacterium]|nr:MAG: dTDP-4-dehydrorhamnose reductase [Chitinophagaceae bacterium]